MNSFTVPKGETWQHMKEMQAGSVKVYKLRNVITARIPTKTENTSKCL